MHKYFDNLGQIGIVEDISPRELPPNAWSVGKNVRFLNNKVTKIKGISEVFATPVIDPWYLQNLQKGAQVFWFYAGENDIGITDGSTHANVSQTSASYSATLDLNWTSAVLPGGAVILNNGADVPQQWTGTTTTDKFSDLTGWPAGVTARSIRSLKNYLVAMDITTNGTRIQEEVRWSSRADIGSVPQSWDISDTTIRAGRTQLGDSGPIIDAFPLRDSLILYQDNNVWNMQEIGGNFVFSFRKILTGVGALSRRCVAEWRNKHAVLSFDDIILHDGSNVQSIANRRVRRSLFSEIDPTNFERSYVVANHSQNEIWFCFPGSGAEYPNLAWVWNWAEDNWYKRDLGCGFPHIAAGIVNDETSSQYDDDSGEFDDATDIFDASNISGAQTNLLMADPADTKLFKGDTTEQFDGVDFYAFVLREALPLGRENNDDLRTTKYITEIIPDINGTDGGAVDFYVGHRMDFDQSTTWEGPFRFTIGTSRKLNMRVSGRIIDIRVESAANIEWSLTGYRIEYRITGER